MLSEISIYVHKAPFDKVLAKLLEKTLSQNLKACILTGSEEEAEALSQSLWTYTPLGFLPHGTLRDGFLDQQPILLTSKQDIPVQRDIVILHSHIPPIDWIKNFKRCVHFIHEDLSSSALSDVFKLYDGFPQRPQMWRQEAKGNWIKEDSNTIGHILT